MSGFPKTGHWDVWKLENLRGCFRPKAATKSARICSRIRIGYALTVKEGNMILRRLANRIRAQNSK